jgi:hypothetical protein
MMVGRIEHVIVDRQYAWIRTSSHFAMWFCHADDLAPETTFGEELVGKMVVFEPEDAPRGPRARAVRLVSGTG